MKIYEKSHRTFLPKQTYYLIRIDGRSFKNYTSKLNKPFDTDLMEDMVETTKYLCEKVQNCVLGYTQSDEISLLLINNSNKNTDTFFGGQVQKIVSICASVATAKFNQLRILRKMRSVQSTYLFDSSCVFVEDMQLANFDARVFTIDEPQEIVNYFIWRQRDGIRNSIQSVAHANFSDKQMFKKNTTDLKEMLVLYRNLNWDNLSIPKQRGTCVIKKEETWVRLNTALDSKGRKVEDDEEIDLRYHTTYIRNIWTPDYEIPIFTEDRDYILKLFKKL